MSSRHTDSCIMLLMLLAINYFLLIMTKLARSLSINFQWDLEMMLGYGSSGALLIRCFLLLHSLSSLVFLGLVLWFFGWNVSVDIYIKPNRFAFCFLESSLNNYLSIVRKMLMLFCIRYGRFFLHIRSQQDNINTYSDIFFVLRGVTYHILSLSFSLQILLCLVFNLVDISFVNN